MAHVFVLILCIGLAGYTSVQRNLPTMLRLGATNAAGMAIDEGGEVGAIDLGREATVIKPIDLPSSPTIPHQPIQYVVQQGDNLDFIASKFHISVDEIRWSNPSLGTTGEPSVGERLWLPPVPGVVVVVKPGDSLKSLAAAFHVLPQVVIDFNYLRSSTLSAGQVLVLPGGHGAELYTSSGSTSSWQLVHGLPDIRLGGPVGNVDGDPFPWGQCTYYVWSRIHVPWRGDAHTWYASAAAAGWSVGKVPRLGAIMVDWESPVYGHVAVVDAVYADGSWLVSEMNYVGLGIRDQRIVRPGEVPLIGFIYP